MSTQPTTTPQLHQVDAIKPLGLGWLGQQTSVGLLSRALRWFQARSQAPRRLQLCATIALGEKRFVSLIECEGQQFLIGGGNGSVSLLTRLPNAADPTTASPSSTISAGGE